MNTNQYQKKTCRYCEAPLGKPFLELGDMPLANSYVAPEDRQKEEFHCPLSLVLCPRCKLVQLSHVVPPDLMFAHYLYVSSTTQTFRDHFAEYAASVRNKISDAKNPLAVDIGSNDGLLLSCYQKEGMRAVGIDPAKNLCEAANGQGLKTIHSYFNAAAVRTILKEHGRAHAISANNVFAHIDDIHGVCRNVFDLLDDKGVFIIEFPYLVVMLEELVFDMIYHEHLSYIAVHPLRFVLERFGLQIFHIDEVASHGGSLRVFIQKKRGGRPVRDSVARLLSKEESGGYLDCEAYQRFAENVQRIKTDFCALLAEFKAQGKSLAGYGAPAKASTILNFYGLNENSLRYVVDDNPLKQNLLIPGVKIPIVPGTLLREQPPDVLILFAWNFAREIIKKIAYLKGKTRFVLPVPAPQTAPAGASAERSFEIS